MKKKSKEKVILILTILLFFALLYFCVNIFKLLDFKNDKESVEVFSSIQIPEIKKNKHPINLDEIISENRNINLKEEMIFEEIDLEYSTQYINNDKLPSGTINVTQLGINGKQDIITIKKYNGDEFISEKIVANNIKKASIDKIVEIGTGKGKNRFKLKVGDSVYSTPTSLPIMKSPDINSEKLITISKGTEVKVLEVLDSGWCYIHFSFRDGYVLSEGLSNINPLKDEQDGLNGTEKTKEELIENLSFDMDISEPSGFSLEQFRKVLSGKNKDKNKIFEENADYFYYAEQEYGINGIFLASLAIHESGWGTSSIALNKYNLFGYEAYDSNPYLSSKQFNSYSEGIDLVARVLIKYYLNTNGTKIYGGDVADGRYYSGKTINSVNKHYATDSNWGNAIYKIMEGLYNDL